MRKLRRLIERYERVFMLGLVIVVLVIFTVTGEIMDWLRPSAADGYDPKAVAGSFAVLPGERTTVTYAQYERARQSLSLATRIVTLGRGERTKPSEIWTHMLLLEAARREGISVSDSELVEFLMPIIDSIDPTLWDDRPRYKDWVRRTFGVRSAGDFEEAVREFLTALRVRDIYRQSFEVAPPAKREDLVKQYTGQGIEFARVSWLALDAKHYLDVAKADLEKDENSDKVLGEFFATDPAAKASPFKFRHPRRYEVEFLYLIHRNLNAESYARLEALFLRAFPDKDVKKLAQPVSAMREYFGIYRDRLLEEAGTSWDEIKAEDEEEEAEPPEDEPKKDEEEKAPEDSGEEEGGDEAPAEGDEEEEPAPEPTAAQKQLWFQRGFDVVSEKVDRELKVRAMLWFLRDEAAKDESKSLKRIYDNLKAHDEEENPVCATEPGKALLVYYGPEQPLTREEIEEIEDSGVKFTHNVVFRITAVADSDLPKMGPKADVLGSAGHGRMIFRVVKVEQERRKSFEELTDAEKEDLRDGFYLPEAARKLAKEVLEGYRKKCEAGELSPEQIAKDLVGGKARWIGDEWILAKPGFMSEPARGLYWPDEYLHMRDRHFLRRRLASELSLDRQEKRIKPGSYLEVQVDSRADADDPGAAYLVLVHERRKPGAETIPHDEFETYIDRTRARMRNQEYNRWSKDFPRVKQQFSMEFYGSMQETIEEELQQRAEAARKATRQ